MLYLHSICLTLMTNPLVFSLRRITSSLFLQTILHLPSNCLAQMISYLVYSLKKIIPSFLPQTMLYLRSNCMTSQVVEYLRRNICTSLSSYLEDRNSRIYSSYSTSVWDQSPEAKPRNLNPKRELLGILKLNFYKSLKCV